MKKDNVEYQKMIDFKNKIQSEVKIAMDHRNDSKEDEEKYRKLSREYCAIRNAIIAGAKNLKEVKVAVEQSIGVKIDLSEPDKPKTTKKDDQPKTEEQSPMFSARIESLIKSAFKDGVLTKKEKETILRRAEKEGEDLDEFEMLLNERIEEMGIKVIEDNSEESPQKLELATSDSDTSPTPPKEKGMFSEKLLFLIDNALEDGVLTDQEKNAIIKRAQDEGEDINEVDIYIQSLQQKRQKELQEKAQKTADEELKASKKAQEAKAKADLEEEKERATILRKCPKCGTLIPNLTNVCPGCGFIVDKAKADETVVEIIAFLNKNYNDMRCNDSGNIVFEAKEYDVSKEQLESKPRPDFYRIGFTHKDTGLMNLIVEMEKVKAEAALYKDNNEINSLLNKIRKKEVSLLLDAAEKGNKNALDNLKINYSDIASQQIAELEDKINSSSFKIVRFLKKNLWWIIIVLLLAYCTCR